MGGLSGKYTIVYSWSVCCLHWCTSNADIGQWHRSSADGLSVSNQTNLAIKGIIGIQAMSKMCSILGQVTEAKNYSVRTIYLLLLYCGIDALADCSCTTVWPMEGRCIRQRPALACGVWTTRLMDARLQFIRRYMARYWIDRILGRYERIVFSPHSYHSPDIWQPK